MEIRPEASQRNPDARARLANPVGLRAGREMSRLGSHAKRGNEMMSFSGRDVPPRFPRGAWERDGHFGNCTRFHLHAIDERCRVMFNFSICATAALDLPIQGERSGPNLPEG